VPAGEGAAAWKRGSHGGRIALVAAGRGGAARRGARTAAAGPAGVPHGVSFFLSFFHF
jgi:hypothetical protein